MMIRAARVGAQEEKYEDDSCRRQQAGRENRGTRTGARRIPRYAVGFFRRISAHRDGDLTLRNERRTRRKSAGNYRRQQP